MASIVQIKQAIKLCKAATDTDMAITCFVWGHRGIGKSSLVRQLCESESWGFIDMRAAQIEASDLRGLPAEDAVRNRTVYRPPADMPIGDLSQEEIKAILEKIEDPEAKYMEYMRLQPRFKHGILFLDELNRAQDDVQQAAFQLILDRRIGQYVLPLGWIVVAAGNFMEGSSYQTNSFMDAAFLSRFCHIILSGGPDSANDWAQFIANKYTNGDSVSHSDVIEVVMQNLTLLDGKVDGNLGFSIQPNRRGWEMVVRILRAAEVNEFDQLVVKSVISGIVGTEAAGLMDTARLPVKPTDLLKTGIKVNIDKLKSLERNQMIGLIWGMVSHCKPKINEEKYARVCVDLMKWMCRGGRDKDIVAAFGRALMSGGVSSQVDTVRAAALTNPELLKIITGRGGAGPKQTTNKVFLDYIESDPELSELLKKTSWGTDPDD